MVAAPWGSRPKVLRLSARNVVYDLADLDTWADQRKRETQRCGD